MFRQSKLQPFVLLATLSVLAGCGANAPDQHQRASISGEIGAEKREQCWLPDERLARSLTNPLELVKAEPRFSLRFPAEYSFQVAEQENRKMVIARGPQRADKRQAAGLVTVIPRTDAQKKLSLSESLGMFLNAIRQGRSAGWEQTAIEQGYISDHEFVRAQWSGGEPVTGKVMRGFIYLAIINNEYVVLSAQDFQEYVPKTLPSLNAAALTFKLADASAKRAIGLNKGAKPTN